tara:strand:+ start:65 stop:601 length:537 start_codon:yes stop_codon:yes gene_type:complete
MRWTAHIEEVEAGKHTNKHIQEIYNEYGCEDWLFEDLMTIKSDDKSYVNLIEGHIIFNHPNTVNESHSKSDTIYKTGVRKGKVGRKPLGDRYELDGMVLYQEYFNTRDEFLSARKYLIAKVAWEEIKSTKGIEGGAYEQKRIYQNKKTEIKRELLAQKNQRQAQEGLDHKVEYLGYIR